MTNVTKGLLFVFGVVLLSLMLDRLNLADRDLEEGKCIEIQIGNTQALQGQIYNLRADGRYNVHYINDKGDHNSITLKRFQFKVVECINNLNNE